MSAIPPWALDYLASALPGNPVLNGRQLSRNRVLANTRTGAVLVKRGLFGGISHEAVEVAQDRVQFRCASCGHNLQFYNLALPATVFCSICAAKYRVAEGGAVSDAAGQSVQAEPSSVGEGVCACCVDGCCETGTCCDHADCSACCEQTGCCKDGCDPATCCPEGVCQCCERHEYGACCELTGCCKDSCDPAACCAEEMCECCMAAKEHGHDAHAGHDHAHAGHDHGHLEEPAAVAPADPTAFTHNGFTLYKREVETKSGSRPLYFFSKGEPKSGEMSPLPAGHEVGINDRTGLPFLRRSSGAVKAPASLTGYKGDSHPVLDVEGIGPTWSLRLHDCGVRTTDELCRTDAQALASRMGEAVETIRFWQQMAELMKVKGIGPQYAEALARSGLHGIDALKAGTAAAIATSTNAWLEEQKQTVIKTRLTAARVTGWQKAAKTMRKVKLAAHPLA